MFISGIGLEGTFRLSGPECVHMLQYSIEGRLLPRLINISYTHIIQRQHLSGIYPTNPYAYIAQRGQTK